MATIKHQLLLVLELLLLFKRLMISIKEMQVKEWLVKDLINKILFPNIPITIQ